MDNASPLRVDTHLRLVWLEYVLADLEFAQACELAKLLNESGNVSIVYGAGGQWVAAKRPIPRYPRA